MSVFWEMEKPENGKNSLKDGSFAIQTGAGLKIPGIICITVLQEGQIGIGSEKTNI